MDRFESVRRPLSWLCIGVFVGSFLALLALSATPYWTPENRWITLLDRVWRISGLVELVLWSLPRFLRAATWIRHALQSG